MFLCLVVFVSVAYGKGPNLEKPQLRFRTDGTFTLVQFTDSQDGPNIDPRTVKLMENILDFEKPDLVVLTGDNIDGRSKTSSEVRKAIDNIAQPMEKRQIPWAIVFGNHDSEHNKMSKKEMMEVYMSYSYNISKPGSEKLPGVGNYNILINGSKNNTPAFNIYMLDSLGYSTEQNSTYDWIKPSQITWYKRTAINLKLKYKKKIPALMFFHIPLPEFKDAYKLGNAVGEKNEEECTPEYNSGLFNVLVKTNDVKGVFVGHDHSNDYVAELKGIKLGYSRSIGYSTYIKQGVSRGGRVFRLDENNPEDFITWMRLESDFVR
jgi:predicted phosphodiesterase